MKSKFILLLAIIMGLITTFLFYNYMEKLNQEKLSNVDMVNILVAQKDIQKNQRISRQMVTTSQTLKKNVHPNSVKEFSEIEGLFATANIISGEPILKHRLQKTAEEKTFISRKIKKGYRALSVGVNIVQSVTNFIEPEDLVDVTVSEEIEENGQKFIKTELLLQNVRVLAVGRRMIQSVDQDPYTEYTSVTLELAQNDAVLLVNAQERGNIHFMLHSNLIP